MSPVYGIDISPGVFLMCNYHFSISRISTRTLCALAEATTPKLVVNKYAPQVFLAPSVKKNESRTLEGPVLD